MDASRNYIRMMEEAWPFLKEGVCIYYSRRMRMLFALDGEVVSPQAYRIDTSNSKRAFPLLEQDQLQELANICECSDPYCLFLDFAKWLGKLPRPSPPYTSSWEQLWLAFAMKQKYEWVWDGENWIS